MRTLTMAIAVLFSALAACGGAQKSAPERMGFDPELADSCAPEWGDTAPESLCEKGEEGKLSLPAGDPAHDKIFQMLSLEENHSGLSVDQTIVRLAAGVIDRDGGPSCGKQMARWHRALAYVRLQRWSEAFKDFGTVVKDGPNNPFYAFVGEWLKKIEPHLPDGAYASCLVNYQAPDVIKSEGHDAHWKPYKAGEKP
jgi:hypothetical protein